MTSGKEPIVGGTWVETRHNVLGKYFEYIPRDNSFERGIEGGQVFFLPNSDEDFEAELDRVEAELLLLASWHVFLKNQKLTGRGVLP